MTRFWERFIIRTVLRPKKEEGVDPETYSSYDLAKGWYELRLIFKGLLRDIALISLGIGCAGFGLKGFLLANDFIDGGATGISLLIAELTGISLSVLLLLVTTVLLLMPLPIARLR